MTVSVVNQWAGTFSQPAAFQTMPPALQSAVVQLIPANSVGGGSGTPTAGNWLVTLIGMNEQSVSAGFTVGVKDDIHSWWRPGKVSTAAALTRTSAWYTANTVRAPGYVYVAPNGAFDALAVLVLELSGTGPWDTLTVTPAAAYAAAATSLNLSLGTPSAASFAIAAVTGDSTTAGQAFAPASWTALHTVSATNGVDHTSDAVLTSAILPSNSGSLSVSASATSAADLSGVIIEFQVSAPSPVPAGQNPAWPYMILEAAIGSGFQTPEDQMTWVSLNNWVNTGAARRFWAWSDQSGVPYALGQLQSSNGTVQLDNADGALSPGNPASLFYTTPSANWSPLAAFYDAQVAAQAPLAWWKLADAAGAGTAADSSGNGRTGTPTSVTFGSTNEAVNGNTAASFASGSSSHILTSYNPALAAVTAEVWVNLNGNTPGTFVSLLANSHSNVDSRGFHLQLTSGSPQVFFGTGTANAGAFAPSPIPVTGWNHIAATWDGATIRLYVNGVQVATGSLAGSMASGTATGIGIGYNPAYSGDFVNGLMAECAVYGSALTAAQIAGHYTAGPAATGTPVRVRMALGTIAGVTYNRWYTWQRNGLAFPEKRNKALRNYVPLTLTDIWSVASSSCLTPYRGEVYQDSPYAWFPMDDQPLSGGVQPSTLRNAAAGNTNTLAIQTNGATAGDQYTTTGVDATSTGGNSAPPPSVAVYAVAQQAGWMYGDPQSSPQAYATGNPVTSSPGSAAWQQTGMLGNTGAQGWFLTCNDNAFPPLAGGMSFGLWFNAAFFGTGTGVTISTNRYDLAGQPNSQITLATLATASAPVAILYLDLSGHLILETFNGATGTNHTIYSASDLRSASWHHVMLTCTTSTWTVYVNGGLTAQVSGSGAGMTSAWTWLVINGDLGASGGSTLSAQVHGGNVAYSHAEVYPSVLPAWRVLGHYCAAITGFGLLPAPQTVAISTVNNSLGGTSYVPDGSLFGGNYGGTGGLSRSTYTFSALAVAQAGSFTSGPSARATNAGFGQQHGGSNFFGDAVWVSWTALAPAVAVYTSASATGETNAATAAGSGDSFSAGYGGSATGAGVCQTAAGSGASPPAGPSSLGDTVAQRVERVLGYGQVTSPNRAIDSTASLLVQAALDVGGQQAGANCQNLVDSDNSLLSVDNQNTLCLRSRPHLAADTVAWFIGMNTIAGMIPFDDSIEWSSDPQRIWDAITVTPYSPDGATLASLTPAAAAAANAGQQQFGPRPKTITSYLQDGTKQQAQVNWSLANFGILQRRGSVIAVNAATHPTAWGMVAGMNVSDIVQIYDAPLGAPATTATFRVSQISRSMSNGANGTPVEAKMVLVCDPLPPGGYWS